MSEKVQQLDGLRGVVRWPHEDSIADLEEFAEQVGRRTIVLDTAEVEDKEAFLELCADAFGLPDWFGFNWDALEECLAEFDHGDGLLVVWSDWSVLAASDPGEFATAVDIFESTARSLDAADTPYAVVLLGPEREPIKPATDALS